MTDDAKQHSMEGSVDEEEQIVNYKREYRNLKRKIKYLIYENETFQESLRKTRRSLLKVSRDRSFLLDQLLQYEKVPGTSSESEETESSDDGENVRPESSKRRRPEPSTHSHGSSTPNSSGGSKSQNSAKKRKPHPKIAKLNNSQAGLSSANLPARADGLMTPEEIERHLTAHHQPLFQLMPEKAPLTVPTDFFSNDPSLDRFSC